MRLQKLSAYRYRGRVPAATTADTGRHNWRVFRFCQLPPVETR